MYKVFLAIIILLFANSIFSQKYTISGYITDGKSGEKMINASVFDATTLKGTITNEYGFYSLTLPESKVKLTVSYVGYNTIQQEIDLKANISLNFQLKSTIELSEVVVSAEKLDNQVDNSKVSVIEIPISQIKSLPVLLGEVDIIKTIQLLPGVQSGGEGTSGLYVRGGGPDQNLILLDGVPVYNADHLFGFFSVFNADAIKNVTLIKGGFPSRYGGRLSSVLDIRMKEGNNQEIKAEGSIGLIASKLTIEGPIIKDKTSFIISGRRTYIDILSQPMIRLASSQSGYKTNAGYYFYDMNLKINHKFSDKSHLYLSSYMGNDKAYVRSKYEYLYDDIVYKNKMKMNLGWGNITSALRWNYKINNKLFSNSTLTYSRYRFIVLQEFEESQSSQNVSFDNKFISEFFSGINDVAGKIDFDFIPNPNHYIRFGANNTYHTFSPGVNSLKYTGLIDTTFGNANIYANEWFAYAEDDIRITARIKANVGIHYSGFFVKEKYYHSFQPRATARFLINEDWSVKAAYSKMNQYIHLLTTAKIGLPTDLWLPVTNKIPPQKSDQYAFAVFHNMKKFEVSLEGYYKTMNNLLEYKEGAGLFSESVDWQEKVEVGNGTAYGSELMIRKTEGKTTGWIGYTLSWSNRKFENLNFGKEFPYRYDRRHDIGVAITHKFNDKVDLGVVWVYGTGNAVTLATEKYIVNPSETNYSYYYYEQIEYFESRNSYRMPSYHRLDIGVNFHKEKKWGSRTVSFGVYNIYNRKNPFFLNFENDQFGKPILVQYSLFPLIPSFSWNFKFGKAPSNKLIEEEIN